MVWFNKMLAFHFTIVNVMQENVCGMQSHGISQFMCERNWKHFPPGLYVKVRTCYVRKHQITHSEIVVSYVNDAEKEWAFLALTFDLIIIPALCPISKLNKLSLFLPLSICLWFHFVVCLWHRCWKSQWVTSRTWSMPTTFVLIMEKT